LICVNAAAWAPAQHPLATEADMTSWSLAYLALVIGTSLMLLGTPTWIQRTSRPSRLRSAPIPERGSTRRLG
jgi:hypothetical protein